MCAIVAANAAAFHAETSIANGEARDRFIASFALVPYDLTHGVSLPPPAPPAFATLVTAQFLHASALHLVVNMLFLLAFGPQIEALFGRFRFVGLYLGCGVLGGIAQVSANPGSHIPSIGASGAIAGILGAFIVRYPTVRIAHVPAAIVIGVWAAVQFVHGFAPVTSDALSERGGGIAYFAHIGGFLAGIFAGSARAFSPLRP